MLMKTILMGLVFLTCLQAAPLVTRQNQVLELSFISTKKYDNPFKAIKLDMLLTGGRDDRLVIPMFWAGGDLWKARLSSPVTGTFTYRTVCSDRDNGLHHQKGEVLVLPYQGENPLYIHGALKIGSGRHIVHADGTPFLWLADSWWHGMTARFRWPEDFCALTRDRVEKGFSVVQFAAGFPCDILEFDSRGANEAGFPVSRNYEQLNPAYFDLVDRRIQHLVENGLVPNVLGTWGYYLPWFGIENMQLYWRYIIARYGAYPVTWTLAGETTLVYYLTGDDKREEIRRFQRDGWSEVARYIKATDPFKRVLTAHPGPASGRFEPISEPSLLDIILVQPGHNGWATLPRALEHLRTARQKYPGRPVMQGEVCFEGMHGGGSDAKLQRTLFWTNMLSGAAGHCYGADAIWQFNTGEELFGKSPGGYVWGNVPFQQAMHWKGSTYVGKGRAILGRFDWQKFGRHPEWIHPAADEENVMAAYAAGIPGKIRLFYFPRGVMPWGQEYSVLKLDSTAYYRAEYIDPLSGRKHPIQKIVSGVTTWQIPPAPILQDWLLVLEKQDKPPKSHPAPVNPNADPKAVKLLDYLYSISGKFTLAGQHNYPGTLSAYTDEVFEITGEFPVVWGQDFGFAASGKDGIGHRDAVILEAVKRHHQGFIITLMWHAVRPTDDEPNGWKASVQNHLSDAEWQELVTPGTPLYLRWLRQLDVVAKHLEVLRDNGIPVLWRPYHEMNGGWFWWGHKKGADGYIALWRNMYRYFTDHHKLDNLLWVWNANELRGDHVVSYRDYYPGPDVVDILAADFYTGNYSLENYSKLLQMADGKPIAIGECGKLPTPDILRRQPYWCWFMCWAGFFTKHNETEIAVDLYRAPVVRTRRRVQWKFD